MGVMMVIFTLYCCSSGEPEELIKHGLLALRETLPNEQELTTKVQYSNHPTFTDIQQDTGEHIPF